MLTIMYLLEPREERTTKRALPCKPTVCLKSWDCRLGVCPIERLGIVRRTSRVINRGWTDQSFCLPMISAFRLCTVAAFCESFLSRFSVRQYDAAAVRQPLLQTSTKMAAHCLQCELLLLSPYPNRRLPFSSPRARAASGRRPDRNCRAKHVCPVASSGVEPDWDAEMQTFRQRTMRPNQLETLRRAEEKDIDVGKVRLAAAPCAMRSRQRSPTNHEV